MRPLDLVHAQGFTDVNGKLVADLGYGGIGHLRLLASLGAHVTGIDPDSYLSALYAERRDQGSVPAARDVRRGSSGSITLAHGFWPKDAKLIERVGQGFDLMLSKNTLKKGYVKPDRKIDKRQMVDLGVSDEVFLKAVFNALNPGGMMMIYNISPKQQDKGYNPQADGRSPYTREQFEKAGFSVIAYNAADDAAIRQIGHALRWDRNAGDEAVDMDGSLFAMYTLVRRPDR
jgi:SAM-dependent methyltransferase